MSPEFQAVANLILETMLDSGARALIRAILTHDRGKAYAEMSPRFQALADGSQNPKTVRAVQEVCRKNLQATVTCIFARPIDPVVQHTVKMAFASLVLNEVKCEVDVNTKKLSQSAYDFTEWLLHKVAHEELRNFRDEQLRLREQRRLEFRVKNASVSGDPGKPKTETGSEISQGSADIPETVPPSTDGNTSIEGNVHPDGTRIADSAKGKAPSSHSGNTGQSFETTGGANSSDQLSFEEKVKKALERDGFPNLL